MARNELEYQTGQRMVHLPGRYHITRLFSWRVERRGAHAIFGPRFSFNVNTVWMDNHVRGKYWGLHRGHGWAKCVFYTFYGSVVQYSVKRWSNTVLSSQQCLGCWGYMTTHILLPSTVLCWFESTHDMTQVNQFHWRQHGWCPCLSGVYFLLTSPSLLLVTLKHMLPTDENSGRNE